MAHAATLSPVEEVAEFFARGPSPEEIARFQLSAAARERVARLLGKEDGGVLTAEERRQLDEVLLLDALVPLIRSRIPARLPPTHDVAGGLDAGL